MFGGYFKGAITVLAAHPAMHELAADWHGRVAYGLHAFTTLPFALMVAGAVIAYYCYVINDKVPAAIQKSLGWLNTILENKYYFDWFNEQVLARSVRCIGTGLWQGGDRGIIDGFVINGATRLVGAFAAIGRRLQSGYIYHYAFAMIIGLMVLISFFVLVHK